MSENNIKSFRVNIIKMFSGDLEYKLACFFRLFYDVKLR